MTPMVSDLVRLMTVNLHALIRDAICALLEKQPRIEVLPQMPACGAGLSSIIGTIGDQPTLLLFNLDDCPHQHLECLAGLRMQVPTARILVLSEKRDITRFRAAIGRGAHGVLMKTEGSSALVEAIHQISQGRVWLDYEIVSQLIPIDRLAGPSRQNSDETVGASLLTVREHEVLMLLCEGMSYEGIADRLGNSVATVRCQIASSTLKLGVKGRSELIAYAYRHGLAQQPFQASTPRIDNISDKKLDAKLYVAQRKLA